MMTIFLSFVESSRLETFPKDMFGKQGRFLNTQVNTWKLGILKTDGEGSYFEISDLWVF